MGYRPFAVDLSGQVALVTGANSGMGKATAQELARMGATVILGCRDQGRGDAAAAEIVAATGNHQVTAVTVDLSSVTSVRAFAHAVTQRSPRLDVLVNNAAASLPRRDITPEGFERHWATNVLGPHLLTTLLLPTLRAGSPARIVNVSTRAAGGLDLDDTQWEHRRFSGIRAYRASKQAVRMLSWAFADRLDATQVTVNALNPGYVVTNLSRNAGGLLKVAVALTRFLAQTPLDGADTAIWLAASPEVRGMTARFWNNRHEVECKFRDAEAVERLWQLVEQQVTIGASGPLSAHQRRPAHA